MDNHRASPADYRPAPGRAQWAHRRVPGFRGTLGAKVVIDRPRDAEAKGLFEQAHDYLERAFLPGRTFAGPADFNAQLAAWWFGGGQAVPPPRVGLGSERPDRRRSSRDAHAAAGRTGHRVAGQDAIGRDHHVRLDGNDYYSVHPAMIGRRVELAADLERVRVRCDGQPVADYARVWARHLAGLLERLRTLP